jgi:uncharacterized protein
MPSALDALKSLQANASAFFERFESKHADKMQCQMGCASCCQVNLTVFESEAVRIWQGFWASDTATQNAVIQDLKRRIPAPENCAFLVDKKCVIYDWRPIICRTQGAALLVPIEHDASSHIASKSASEKQKKSYKVDVCPLNFVEADTKVLAPDALNLERLTTLQTLAEQQYQSLKKSAREDAVESSDSEAINSPSPLESNGQVGAKRFPAHLIEKERVSLSRLSVAFCEEFSLH